MFLILLLGGHITNIKKATIGSFILVSFIVLLISSLLFGIIAYPTSTENYFPFFELSRLISFGRFVQRVESLYTLIWLLAVYLYITLDTSFIVQIFSKAFNLKFSHRGRVGTVEMTEILSEFNIPCVNILDEHYILPDTIEELRDFVNSEPSRIDGKMKEGIVFRSPDVTRSFKCVSPEFLIKFHNE